MSHYYHLTYKASIMALCQGFAQEMYYYLFLEIITSLQYVKYIHLHTLATIFNMTITRRQMDRGKKLLIWRAKYIYNVRIFITFFM